jgi:hypothetical protein
MKPLEFFYLSRHYFKWVAAILTDGAICLTTTYSAASFDWPPHIQWRVLTYRRIK